MQITNSPDISVLDIGVTFDISQSLPFVSLVNNSQGNNLAGVSYAFVVTSPSGTPIHSGDINNPDVSGVWTNFTLNDSWPRPFNQIEWSGAPYQFVVIAKDSVGNIINGQPQLASICRPLGNTPYSKTTYGIASSDVSVKCEQARIFFQDNTYSSYKGSAGVQQSSVLRVIYPIDETATIPAPFVTGQYSTALVPISYSSSNYQFLQYSIYTYDLGNDTFVNIRYQVLKTFSVWCNIDLLPLKCEIDNLINQVETGNCSDVVSSQKKMSIVMAKFCLVIMGIEQPLIGVDVPKLVNEIIEIGGFDCNCCGAPSGIIPTTASIIDGYSFSFNKLGGDVNGYFSTNGVNITLNLGDTSYVVAIGQGSPSTVSAFSFEPSFSADGFVKTYYLNIDGHELGLNVLANIAANADSLNVFAAMVNSVVAAASLELIVDGGCIFSSTVSCDYDFTLSNIPASVTYALLSSLKVGDISHVITFAFNLTNLVPLQTYLNGLGFGVFTVTNLGGGNILIQSNGNTNELIALTYKVASVNYTADFSRNCTGYAPLSANQVVQNIIDYLCGLTDLDVVTSEDYIISYINPSTGLTQTQTVPGGSSLNSLISALLNDGVETINYIQSLSALNCANVQNVFPQSVNTLQANDFILGTKSGSCARIYPVELITDLLNMAAFNTVALEAFCNLVVLCRAGKPCTPFSIFSLNVIDDSPFDNNQSIVVSFTNTDPEFIGVAIEYARIDNTSNPIYNAGAIENPITPGDSPYTISGLPIGQYSVSLQPLFSDGRSCPAVYSQTPACGTISAFGLSISSNNQYLIITYTTSSPLVYLNITAPNGSSFSGIYGNGGSVTILISSISSAQSGTYTAYLRPVCDASTGWMGPATAPAFINVQQPQYRISASISNVCTISPVTLYTKTPFAVGVIMYFDSAFTTPVTGYNVLADSTGAIYSISSSTGLIQYNTGLNCNNGTAGVYTLGTDSSTVCGLSTVVLYTNGAFAIGGRLYVDSALTTLVNNSFTFTSFNGNKYNLANAVVGSLISSCP